MGIKLDWQVESEQTSLAATEDAGARRERQRARRRLMVLVIGLAGALCLVAALLLWRWQRVADHYQQDLLDTVAVEITALRLGDFAAYMAIQRSASESFMLDQSRRFEEYQQLKQARRITLDSEPLAVTIDKLRGRVIVRETLDGVPYRRVWFYWYYEDGGETGQGGWRHVPDDLTFWGEPREIVWDAVTLAYRELDGELAEALAPRLAQWWVRGCDVLRCAAPPPPLRVEIVAERPPAVEWAAYAPWTLRITSPLVERARADMPIPPELEYAVARQLAARLVRYAAGDALPVDYADAAWLHLDLARWLTNDLLAGEGVPLAAPGFVESLIAQHGPGAPLTVLGVLTGTAALDDIMLAVTGLPMPLLTVEQLNSLSWPGFFQWRLELEARLLNQADAGGAFLALYDLENPTVADLARLRLADPVYATQVIPQVGTVIITRDAGSQTYAQVQVTHTEFEPPTTDTLVWRLAGGTWKRTN